jgi:pilus assembly protein CpaB
MAMAAIMAILSVFVFKNMMNQKPAAPEAAKPAKVETQEIAVAAVPLSPGQILTVEDVKLVSWPKQFLPEGQVFHEADRLIGRIVKGALLPGEPVYRQKLAGEASTGGLPVLIPNGMRGITMGVSEIKQVAGFVRPGDRVDILGTFEENIQDPVSNTNKTIKVTRTVLENVLVIATAQDMVQHNNAANATLPALEEEPEVTEEKDGENNTDKDSASEAKAGKNSDASAKKEKEEKAKKEDKKEGGSLLGGASNKGEASEEDMAKVVSSVTVALTPADAETLTLAEETGSVRLVLRGELDHQHGKPPGTNTVSLVRGGAPMGNLFAPKLKAEPAKPAAALPVDLSAKSPFYSVELIEGGEKSAVDF